MLTDRFKRAFLTSFGNHAYSRFHFKSINSINKKAIQQFAEWLFE
ncbi:hypothetical protein RR47_GL000475 [Enterococcus columbae DSM 7374 = ATCC 51263]|nr:hypothetical protein RR47_GL000475 [Enterococcus columbae DSM 7374 = ATCC 51263]